MSFVEDNPNKGEIQRFMCGKVLGKSGFDPEDYKPAIEAAPINYYELAYQNAKRDSERLHTVQGHAPEEEIKGFLKQVLFTDKEINYAMDRLNEGN